jgi:hypothetical protein
MAGSEIQEGDVTEPVEQKVQVVEDDDGEQHLLHSLHNMYLSCVRGTLQVAINGS